MRSVLNNTRLFFTVAVVLLVGIFPAYVFFGIQNNAFAALSDISGQLDIPQLQLSTPVQTLKLENNQFETPDIIAGAYQAGKNNTFIIGHSSTVFQNLSDAQIGSTIRYNNENYIVNGISIMKKTDINMSKVLASRNYPTLTLMTCAGENWGGGDYSHRLILTAVKIDN